MSNLIQNNNNNNNCCLLKVDGGAGRVTVVVYGMSRVATPRRPWHRRETNDVTSVLPAIAVGTGTTASSTSTTVGEMAKEAYCSSYFDRCAKEKIHSHQQNLTLIPSVRTLEEEEVKRQEQAILHHHQLGSFSLVLLLQPKSIENTPPFFLSLAFCADFRERESGPRQLA